MGKLYARFVKRGDLVFDIGANNGDDTGFYLAKGFRVVAVDAIAFPTQG